MVRKEKPWLDHDFDESGHHGTVHVISLMLGNMRLMRLEISYVYINGLIPVHVELLVVQLLFIHSRCKASSITKSRSHTIATVASSVEASIQLDHFIGLLSWAPP
jgi:hypothetical protein